MSDGVLYKYNASAASKSQSKKFNASTMSDGRVRHANASTWYDNYPMEQLYTQKFNVVWTKGYTGSGTFLDEATWGDHPRSGGSADFRGLFGFDRTAMQNFVGTGAIQYIKFTCMFDDPAHSGNPVVNFATHKYTSKPSSFSTANVQTTYKATSQFNQTGADYTRTITLPVGAWWSKNMAGIYIYGTTAAADSCRFAGKTTSHEMNWYNSVIEIQVLK